VSASPRGDDVRPVAESHGPSAQEPAVEPEPPAGEQASVDVMRLLSEHVPLTLLADLAQPTGPDSPDILEHEGLPDVAWWESTAEEQR
jgi:hypothetical protein